MAAALLADRLGRAGLTVQVRSAGVSADGQGAPPEVAAVMAGYGLDVGGHRSRPVTTSFLRGAGLIIGMARQHVRHAVVAEPDSWPRTFTLKEIVRRGAEFRARSKGEPLQDWLAGVHDGRERGALLGDAAEDDIADPMGGPMRAYVAAAAEIEHFTRQLAGLCWGVPADMGVPGRQSAAGLAAGGLPGHS